MRDEKLQYDINREAAKISALSSEKIDKYEYLTGESYKLKQIESIFPQNLMNDLISAKLKKIVELQDIIQKDDQNAEKLITLVNIYCLLFFFFL